MTPPPAATASVDPSPGVDGRGWLGSLNNAFGGSGAGWLLVPPILFLGLMLMVPLGYLVVLAFEHTSAGKTGFGEAFGDHLFWAAMWRTFVLAAVVSFFTLVFGTLYAIAIAAAPKWLAIVLLIALFTIFWTSLLVRTYGWLLLDLPQGGIYWALHGLGLRDKPLEIFQTNTASYPAMVHVMLPYVVLPVLAATRQLDPMQIRAARVLGAKPPLILWKVLLPALRGGIIAGAVLVFVMSLGFYVTPTLLGDPTKQMVASTIGHSFSVPGAAPTAAAMSLSLLAIVVIVYLVADKVFRVSETWGGDAA
ncbi:MAG: ABC transporter permease [Actinobacteria bacterium]|nr:ABC transporter permease [Actinomycetota bacterium]